MSIDVLNEEQAMRATTVFSGLQIGAKENCKMPRAFAKHKFVNQLQQRHVYAGKHMGQLAHIGCVHRKHSSCVKQSVLDSIKNI